MTRGPRAFNERQAQVTSTPPPLPRRRTRILPIALIVLGTVAAFVIYARQSGGAFGSMCVDAYRERFPDVDLSHVNLSRTRNRSSGWTNYRVQVLIRERPDVWLRCEFSLDNRYEWRLDDMTTSR